MNKTKVVWLQSSALRAQVAELMGLPVEHMRDAQWIGHILKRIHLVDAHQRKRTLSGMTYAIRHDDVSDMMRNYGVAPIE